VPGIFLESMMNKTLATVVTHAFGIGNALCAVSSIAGGIYSMAAVNLVAMVYISTTKISSKEKI
jgi:hypothetical protein